MDKENTCLFTGEYCEGLELSVGVCISCDIGMDGMPEEEQMRHDGVCESDINMVNLIIKKIKKNQ